ncbi:MAG TPA: hypothetical protein VHQ87_11640 [Rhizobacter sp.]|nr:hypothetical protein [Rhizobacter sp.]
MNEELEPLGLPTPPAGDPSRTLGELVAQHPLTALAAAAAAGAGVMALIVAAQRRDDGGRLPINSHVTQMYAELRNQLGKLAERVNASLPTKQDMAQTASDLGGEASKLLDTTVDAAKRSFGGTAAAGKRAAQTAIDHPLLTSLVLGALGALAASLAPHAETSSSDVPPAQT